MQQPPRSRWRKLLRYTLVTAVLLGLAYVLTIEYMRNTMQSMNCKKVTADKFNKSFASNTERGLYVPAGNEVLSTSHFYFNLAPMSDDVLFLIESNRRGQPVYLGPYRKHLEIPADRVLRGEVEEDGRENKQRSWWWDSFRFVFFDKATHTICVSEQDGGFPPNVWKPDSRIHIDFLPYQELDPMTNHPIGFKVWAE